MNTSDQSSSDFIRTDILDFDKCFTDLTELRSEGFNRLVKAKRYGKWFLLKGLKPEYASQSLYKELLRKEFEISVALEHPNIVHTIGIEKVPSLGYCIIFEYLEGYTLKEYLKTRHPLQERRRISDELMDAVAYVHERQIVHRDLKPENIIVTSNGHHVKLIDFGLADTDAHAILKQPAGTEKYISPEQKESSTADCRNDIYSLGKILLEITAGRSYRLAAQQCLRSLDKRYTNVSSLRKRIEMWQRIGKAARYCLYSFILIGITLIYTYNYGPIRNDSSLSDVNEIITYGKKKVDEISKPLRIFVDTVHNFNEDSYRLNQELVRQREQQLKQLVDSLTTDHNESEKAIIRNAIENYTNQTTPHF